MDLQGKALLPASNKAVIFDMDGVISDTQKIHDIINCELFSQFGIHMTPEQSCKQFAGMPMNKILEYLFKNHNITDDIPKAVQWKWDTFLQRANQITEIPGASKLIKQLYSQQIPIAVASSSNRDVIIKILMHLKLIQYFQVIVSGQDVKNGKPNPDIFLLAAKKLNIRPEHCIVVEDSINGMLAAKNANMQCIGLVPKKDTIYPAPIQVTSLDQIKIKKD